MYGALYGLKILFPLHERSHFLSFENYSPANMPLRSSWAEISSPEERAIKANKSLPSFPKWRIFSLQKTNVRRKASSLSASIYVEYFSRVRLFHTKILFRNMLRLFILLPPCSVHVIYQSSCSFCWKYRYERRDRSISSSLHLVL